MENYKKEIKQYNENKPKNNKKTKLKKVKEQMEISPKKGRKIQKKN